MSLDPSPPVFVVLVVDDDKAIRVLLTTLLARQGVAVECAGDGEQALKRLLVKDYAAIILDLMLPGMSGFDVIAHLKKTTPELLCRVIVLTAVSQLMLEHFDGTAVRRLIRKPFDINDVVNEVLACGNGWSATATRAVPGAA